LGTPRCNALNQRQRKRFLERKLNAAARVGPGRELLLEGRDGGGTRVHADMAAKGREMDQVAPLPEGRDAVTDALIGERRPHAD